MLSPERRFNLILPVQDELVVDLVQFIGGTVQNQRILTGQYLVMDIILHVHLLHCIVLHLEHLFDNVGERQEWIHSLFARL